jgi:hypothetical protein
MSEQYRPTIDKDLQIKANNLIDYPQSALFNDTLQCLLEKFEKLQGSKTP